MTTPVRTNGMRCLAQASLGAAGAIRRWTRRDKRRRLVRRAGLGAGRKNDAMSAPVMACSAPAARRDNSGLRRGRGGPCRRLSVLPFNVSATPHHQLRRIGLASVRSALLRFPVAWCASRPAHQGLTRAGPGAFSNPNIGRPAQPLGSKGGMPRLHQLGGPVGRSINLHKTDIKSLSSRDAARRAEVVRVVSSTISIKCPTRSTKASPTTR